MLVVNNFHKVLLYVAFHAKVILCYTKISIVHDAGSVGVIILFSKYQE
jgi:hypothetical protein